MTASNRAREALNRCLEAEALLREHNGNYWNNHILAFRSAWSDFLMYAGRTFTKVEQLAKSSGPNWFDQYKHQRRTDDLLRYLWHARNVDEHGLEVVLELQTGSIHSEIPSGKPSSVNFAATHDGKIFAVPGNKWTKIKEQRSPRLILCPVRDRDKTYDPPVCHLGSRLTGCLPIDLVAPYTLFITGMVDALECEVLHS